MPRRQRAASVRLRSSRLSSCGEQGSPRRREDLSRIDCRPAKGRNCRSRREVSTKFSLSPRKKWSPSIFPPNAVTPKWKRSSKKTPRLASADQMKMRSRMVGTANLRARFIGRVRPLIKGSVEISCSDSFARVRGVRQAQTRFGNKALKHQILSNPMFAEGPSDAERTRSVVGGAPGPRSGLFALGPLDQA